MGGGGACAGLPSHLAAGEGIIAFGEQQNERRELAVFGTCEERAVAGLGAVVEQHGHDGRVTRG